MNRSLSWLSMNRLVSSITMETRFQYHSRATRRNFVWIVYWWDRVTSVILIMAKDATISKFYFGVSKKRPTEQKQGRVQGERFEVERQVEDISKKTGINFTKTRLFTAAILCNEEKFYKVIVPTIHAKDTSALSGYKIRGKAATFLETLHVSSFSIQYKRNCDVPRYSMQCTNYNLTAHPTLWAKISFYSRLYADSIPWGFIYIDRSGRILHHAYGLYR